MSTPDTTTTTQATTETGTVLTAVESTTTKPGYKTTEFWLSFLAALVGAFMASGLVADGSQTMRIAGMAAMVLATMGYSVVRGAAKKGGSALVLLFALTVVPTSSGCASLKDSGKRVAGDIVDCGKAEAKEQIAAYGPAMAGVVLSAVDNRGKFDKEQLRPVGAALKTAAQRCVFASAIAEVARRFAPNPEAPQSEGLIVDTEAARADFAALSDELYGGQRFAVAGGVL